MADDEILATLSPSIARRYIGVGTIGALGLLLVWLSLTAADMPVVWRAVLCVGGIAALAGTQKMWLATSTRLELTAEVLRDNNGVVLAEVSDIVAVERGALAFKPSNGFMVRTRSNPGRAWAPGLWWRLGTRIGVGGVTSAAEAKFMAEALSLLITDPSQMTRFGSDK